MAPQKNMIGRLHERFEGRIQNSCWDDMENKQWGDKNKRQRVNQD
jgi:hypothetical protein